MADAVTITTLSVRPLSVRDAAGLTADVDPRSAWLPSHLVQSTAARDSPLALPVAITTAADVWRVRFQLSSVWPAAVFVPVRWAGEFYSNAGTLSTFGGFWEDDFAWTMSKDGAATETLSMYRVAQLGPAANRVAAASPTWTQTIGPVPVRGFPVWPQISRLQAHMAECAFTVATFDATIAAGLVARFDLGWLVYPEPASRSSGLYAQQLLFPPQ